MTVIDYDFLCENVKWPDFHDSSLRQLTFSFLDISDLTYKSEIKMSIVLVLKLESEPRMYEFSFSPVSNIKMNANMNDKNLADSCDIYSLVKKDNVVTLETTGGWELSFETKNIILKEECFHVD